MSAEARSGDHRVVLYVDGGLDAVERAAFEAALEQSAELRRDVRHARVLRDLVAALPRRRAPLPELDALLERLDVEAGTEGQPAVARLLRSLPAVAAPVGALDHVVGLALRERSRRRPAVLPLRRVALQLAAAAVVVFAAVGLWRSG
jgi:hypothetical protein